jgi:hypothetical protein
MSDIDEQNPDNEGGGVIRVDIIYDPITGVVYATPKFPFGILVSLWRPIATIEKNLTMEQAKDKIIELGRQGLGFAVQDKEVAEEAEPEPEPWAQDQDWWKE